MSPKSSAFRSIALCLRGFEMSPEQVELLIGVPASELGSKGEPVKSGVKTLLSRSFVRFSMEFKNEIRLDEMVPVFFDSLGGVRHLSEVRDRVLPEFFDVGIALPVKSSGEQDGGFLPPGFWADLCLLRTTLSFQFV